MRPTQHGGMAEDTSDEDMLHHLLLTKNGDRGNARSSTRGKVGMGWGVRRRW